MADKPIYGYATNNPVTKLDGTPVTMESPNPNTPWTYTNQPTYPQNCTTTVTSGLVTSTPTSSGAITFISYCDIFLTYTGTANINVALAWSTNINSASVDVRRIVEGVLIGGAGGILLLQKGGTTSGSLATPYYRYRLRVNLGASGTSSMTTADWVTATITFS